jgi:RecB family exonuclease
MPIRIRQSEIGTFMECRRRWEYEYLRGLELDRNPNQPTPNLSVGSVFHRAHEAFWSGGEPLVEVDNCAEEVLEAVAEHYGHAEPLSHDWLDLFTLARAMCRHYEKWLAEGHTMHEQVMHVEQELEWEFRPGVFITGKLDRLSYDRVTQQGILIDLKTCKSFMRALTHARQLKTYAVLLRREGISVERLVTEQVRKVLGTGTAKPPFVDRVEMFVDDDVLDRHESDMEAVLDEMLELRARYEVGDTSRLYPNPTGDCSWKCPYLPLCVGKDNGDNLDYMIRTTYRKKEGDHL